MSEYVERIPGQQIFEGLDSPVALGPIPKEPLVPPNEDRLLQPGERLETPINSHTEIVDVERLIELVKSTVTPGYEWRGKPDPHHLQHQSSWYKSGGRLWNQDSDLLDQFRELPIHKIFVPREFHDYLHQITVPPPVPSEEAQHWRVEGWTVAVNLFEHFSKRLDDISMYERRRNTTAKNPHIVEKHDFEDLVAMEWYEGIAKAYFNGLEQHLPALQSIPEEFQVINPLIIEASLLRRGVPDQKGRLYQKHEQIEKGHLDPRLANMALQHMSNIGRIARTGHVEARQMVDA